MHEMHRITGFLPSGALIPTSTAAAYTLAMATAAAQAAQAAQLTQRFQQAAAVAQAAQGTSAGNYSAFTGAPTGAYYIPGTSFRLRLRSAAIPECRSVRFRRRFS